jgi:hypothetical protein
VVSGTSGPLPVHAGQPDGSSSLYPCERRQSVRPPVCGCQMIQTPVESKLGQEETTQLPARKRQLMYTGVRASELRRSHTSAIPSPAIQRWREPGATDLLSPDHRNRRVDLLSAHLQRNMLFILLQVVGAVEAGHICVESQTAYSMNSRRPLLQISHRFRTVPAAGELGLSLARSSIEPP